MAKLIVLGDSITQGWDGHQQVSNPIPTQLGKLAGFNDVTNLSVGGTAITGPKVYRRKSGKLILLIMTM